MHHSPFSLSFTDEDVVEFHVHGSPAVVNATLRSLSHIPYFRVAEPGEFTKRAFLNGKMSFLEVEALADLLNAETETQRQQAMHGLSGELSALCWKWRSQLMHSLAHAETILEFSDDMDDESVLLADATRQLGSIRDSMQQLLRGFRRSQLVKEGIRVTLFGPPNVGKSSLLNVLTGSEEAIVSAMPGTTRDVLKVDLDLEGWKVILQDTAGLHDSEEVVEREGMNRARAAVAESAVRMVVVDVARDAKENVESMMREIGGKGETESKEKMGETDLEGKENTKKSQLEGEVLVVLNKSDLVSKEQVEEVREYVLNKYPFVQSRCGSMLGCRCSFHLVQAKAGNRRSPNGVERGGRKSSAREHGGRSQSADHARASAKLLGTMHIQH